MRTRLQHAVERLDAPHHDRAELEESLDQVAEVNRMLGGTRAVLRTMEPLLENGGVLRVLDVGTGSADIPIALSDHARRRGRSVAITAIDVHPQMRSIALDRVGQRPDIRIAAGDALHLPYADRSFDVVLLSLTLHHFEDTDQVQALREAARVAGRAVIVNELERCRANYLGARFLAATRWRRNRLTRHDGPLSVLRAFTPHELLELATAAGLTNAHVRRRFFHRLVLTATFQ